MKLSVGYSPCPNDTFIFDALVHGRVDAPGLEPDARLADVETLNVWAREARLDVTKASYGVVPWVLDEYVLLRSGGALGRGCGPLLVTRPGTTRESLRRGRIAIPGRYTTAHLLLRLFAPELPAATEMVFSEIMPAVERGDADAGLIIHESRFTYPQHGLVELVDLGRWWEEETGLPIPLGGILARRSLGGEALGMLDRALRRSVEHALARPADSADYVRAHAQEMDPDVMRQHIELYVNRHTVDVGEDGQRAIEQLLRRATEAGLAPAAEAPLRG